MFLSSLVDKLQLDALQLKHWLRSSVRAVFITGSDITLTKCKHQSYLIMIGSFYGRLLQDMYANFTIPLYKFYEL